MTELSDLPVIETRYPGLGVTYDLAPLLVNETFPFREGSVTATVEDNFVVWDCRIDGGVPAENRRLIDGLPAELAPPVTVTRGGAQGHDFALLSFHSSGWIFLTDANRQISPGVISFEARTRRRAQ